MADISDVEQAFVSTITSILYPAGPSQSSIVGSLCRIYRGWPNAATLNADLTGGNVNVTIGSDNKSGRTTTRFLNQWHSQTASPGTTAAASGQTITVTGEPALGDVIGAIIDGMPFAYRISAGDTTDLVASNLSLLIEATRMANVQGSTITIPGSCSVIARVVCDNSASFEARRQEKDLRIIFWCPSPTVRDVTAAAVDEAFSQITFLALSDGSDARVIYHDTEEYDQAQNALLYRRDLVYTVEYPTITTIQIPSMLLGASDLNSNIRYG